MILNLTEWEVCVIRALTTQHLTGRNEVDPRLTDSYRDAAYHINGKTVKALARAFDRDEARKTNRVSV